MSENITLTKEVLTLNELAAYTGFSKSHIYKLTHKNEIPHYKPSGKCIFFNLKEINEWLMRNRTAANSEIEQQAGEYLMNRKNKG
ncbi:MAG: hypothetical protein BGO40_01865 [Chryseobacterium sp. 39-10]|nr:helix-turn-helix domain-containing protein [Chryseobacterium sp.]OJV48290.1 MAG: hypothetical protein BGO40_01865 [Chryseobacterium sp. 39-10]